MSLLDTQDPQINIFYNTQSSQHNIMVIIFWFAAVLLLNTLPNNVKEASSVTTFKDLLKTHLFQQYFVKYL